MITIKSPDEIKKIEYAANVVAKIHNALKDEIKEGVSGIFLSKIANKIIKKNNCSSNFLNYYGYPDVICVSVNEQLVHGIPNNKMFKNGDVVSIDVGCKYQGYHADAAFTVIVGEDKKYQKLVDVALHALNRAINILKPGVHVGDISAVIQEYVTSNGFYLPRGYTGHGIGTNLHEDPAIPNTGIKNTGPKLLEGMVICIEPMVQIGTDKTRVLNDGWTVVSKDGSVSAHFEHTILITHNGAKILSKII